MASTSSGERQPLILLIGPPNVGKSVIFNYLSGLDVAMANYPGTTVNFTEAEASFDNVDARIIDVPGTYTLSASNEAEEVAVRMLDEDPDLVVCVLDGGHMETSIHLALQVMERGLPTVCVVNRIDLLREKGLEIDRGTLIRQFNVPVMMTAAVTGEGMPKLRSMIASTLKGKNPPEPAPDIEASWENAEKLHDKAIFGSEKKTTSPRDRIGDMLMRPWPGLLIALGVLVGVFAVVVGLGMGLRRFLLLPLFNDLIIPQIVNVVQSFMEPTSLRDVMIGEYGFLTKGLEWPFTLVLPYVLSFYLALSFLEDSGYMPRLGVMLDGLLGKIGLSGAGVIPLLLGYGCGIPAIMSTRALPSRKNRVMVALMVSLTVPCMAQTGAFISLLASRSVGALAFVAALSLFALIFSGLVLGRLIPGETTPTVMEIPDLLMPQPKVLGKKLWIRTKHYLQEAVPAVVIGVAIAAVLYETGAMAHLGRALSPLVEGLLRLPEDAAVPILLGVFRRELTVLPLLEMNLTTLQLTVGSVVGLFYVPCVAMLAVLVREFGIGFAIMILVVTTTSAFVAGGLLAHLGALVM